jgi:hypothetical protein
MLKDFIFIVTIGDIFDDDEFTTPLDLVGRGLEEGREYYIVRAHQGATGEWYNPY